MHLLRIGLAVALSAIAAASCVYHMLAASWLRRWLRSASSHDPSAPLPPVTFFRPLKSGVPGLRGKLEILVNASQAADQLLFGVEADSPEEALCEATQRAFPMRDITIVRCAPGAAINPKISKLAQMEVAARHEHWIVSDSEALAARDFFMKFRQEWTDCDVLTAGYRFAGLSEWPQRLDAAATLLTLWPGLAAVWRSGRVSFTLGACTAFRRSDISAIGGWRAFGAVLAEDQRIGATLAAAGKRIRFSTQIATLDSDPLSWRDYWRHQRRVAATYRVANPAGFAGAIAVQGVSASLALVLLRPEDSRAWGVFFLTVVIRYAFAGRTSRMLSFPIRGLLPVIFAASLVETTCWLLSWSTGDVWWGGKRWTLNHKGEISQGTAKEAER